MLSGAPAQQRCAGVVFIDIVKLDSKFAGPNFWGSRADEVSPQYLDGLSCQSFQRGDKFNFCSTFYRSSFCTMDGLPAEWIPFLDPNYPGLFPPIPPQAAPGSKRKMQVVWPRDKNQKGAHTWGRFRDVLSGKGPDMWVKGKGDIGPTRPEWSRWDMGSKGGIWHNLGYWDTRDRQIPPWRPGMDDEQKLYNFNTRKYEVPHDNTWSDVKWDRNGRKPIYIRDRWARHHWPPSPVEEPGVNPFIYNPENPWWDWYFNEVPPGLKEMVWDDWW